MGIFPYPIGRVLVKKICGGWGTSGDRTQENWRRRRRKIGDRTQENWRRRRKIGDRTQEKMQIWGDTQVG